MSATMRRLFVAAVIATVAIVIGTGLWLVGSPAEERARRIDARRVAELATIAAAIDVHWTRAGTLPATLTELERTGEPSSGVADPVTGTAYAYRVIDPSRYELCATFERASGGPNQHYRGAFWAHGPGHQCFELTPKRVGP